ncbi:MAG: TIGR04283 family arsenosugar biosynthesis glycosyltransferase [bacterium]
MKAGSSFTPGDKTTILPLEKQSPFVSIIIPTLNEAANVRQQVEALGGVSNVEVIFCDGGSTDGTVQFLQDCTCIQPNTRLIESSCGRAIQMNAAAAGARGEWLIFLHADTSLPAASLLSFCERVQTLPELHSGAFTFRIQNSKWAYRYLEFYVGLRSKLFKLPFGDQAIFVKRELFEAIGGYREDYPLMEDFEIMHRLKKRGGFRIIDAPVYTSARRFEQDGFLKRTCGNLYLQFLYICGVHPKKLAEKYWK